MKIKTTALTVALSIALAPAQARDTKTVILLEVAEAIPIQCDYGAYAGRAEECVKLSKIKSENLYRAVNVEMRLDPDCSGMAFAKSFSDLGSFEKGSDYINASVTYLPPTNENTWWLNIVTINGKQGPD